MDPEVTAFIEKLPADQKAIMQQMRDLIFKAIPGVIESIKWGRPVFTAKKDIIYLKSAKAYVTLGFFDAQKLDAYAEKLEGTGKQMRHLKIRKAEEIDPKVLSGWFRKLAS